MKAFLDQHTHLYDPKYNLIQSHTMSGSDAMLPFVLLHVQFNRFIISGSDALPFVLPHVQFNAISQDVRE